jgi:hypothetical protein
MWEFLGNTLDIPVDDIVPFLLMSAEDKKEATYSHVQCLVSTVAIHPSLASLLPVNVAGHDRASSNW